MPDAQGHALRSYLNVVLEAQGLRMDIQKIKQLIDVLAASDLAEIELVEGEHRVRLVRRRDPLAASVEPFQPVSASAPAPTAGDAASSTGTAAATAQPQQAQIQVRAPLYGVVHLTPAPEAPEFVLPGDLVDAGQTLCVLEAMKMFHEVKAERAARVVAVLAAAGDDVEAGAPLFQLEMVEADV